MQEELSKEKGLRMQFESEIEQAKSELDAVKDELHDAKDELETEAFNAQETEKSMAEMIIAVNN